MNLISDLWHSQNQCKNYRFQYQVAKTITKFQRRVIVIFWIKFLRKLYKWFAKDGFLSGWVMRWELLKKLSWSKPQVCWLERLFYINDIITSLQKPKNNINALRWIIILNYVTQLGESFCCPDSKFSFEPEMFEGVQKLLERWQRSGLWNVKLPFTTEWKRMF